MIKSRTTLIVLTVSFLLYEYVVAAFMYNIGGMFSNFSYTFVISACVFCALFVERTWDYAFTQIGLLCTVGADYFLVLVDEQQRLPGMLFFSAAQVAYFCRLYFADKNEKSRRIHLILRVAASVALPLICLIVLGKNADGVALVSMFYYANLFLNVVFALKNFEKPGIFAIGLLVFLISDTVIGFHNLDCYFPIKEGSALYKFFHSSSELIYGFYLPSQVLICTSLLPRRLAEIAEKKQKINAG